MVKYLFSSRYYLLTTTWYKNLNSITYDYYDLLTMKLCTTYYIPNQVGIIQWFLFTMDVLQFWLRLRFFLFACVWLSFPSLRSGLLNEQREALQGVYAQAHWTTC